MKGAFGFREEGFCVTESTVKACPVSADVSACADASSRWTAPSRDSRPSSSKSDPVATLAPSTVAKRPGNGPGRNCASMPQYSTGVNAMRSRSRSTTRRTATDWTRPADFASRPIFFHKTSDTG